MASTFLLVTIMLVLLCHTQGEVPADIVTQASTSAQNAIVAGQAAIKVAEKYVVQGKKGDPATECVASLESTVEALNKYVDVLKAYTPSRVGEVNQLASIVVPDLDGCDAAYSGKEPADLQKAIADTARFLGSLEVMTDKL